MLFIAASFKKVSREKIMNHIRNFEKYASSSSISFVQYCFIYEKLKFNKDLKIVIPNILTFLKRRRLHNFKFKCQK